MEEIKEIRTTLWGSYSRNARVFQVKDWWNRKTGMYDPMLCFKGKENNSFIHLSSIVRRKSKVEINGSRQISPKALLRYMRKKKGRVEKTYQLYE